MQLPIQSVNVMIAFLLAIYKMLTAVGIILRHTQKTNCGAVFRSNVFNSKYQLMTALLKLIVAAKPKPRSCAAQIPIPVSLAVACGKYRSSN